jgi:hypothetical protein
LQEQPGPGLVSIAPVASAPVKAAAPVVKPVAMPVTRAVAKPAEVQEEVGSFGD